MKIAFTGAGGLIGSPLMHRLHQQGHTTLRLIRPPHEPREGQALWDPRGGMIDRDALQGCDAVINLAGENLFGLWTHSKRDRIYHSRVDGTRLLAETLASLDPVPRVFISASAVGWYGSCGDELVTEAHAPGEGFLACTCIDWERAANPAREAGIRIVHPRIAMVLSHRGGALAAMLRPFRLGLGGRLGSGRQHWPWIALDDLLALIEHALMDESLSGPVNASSPNPVTNAEFTDTLARILHRPAVIPAPEFVLKALPGGIGREMFLSSTRAIPAVLENTTFNFQFPTLAPTLEHEIAQAKRQPSR